MQPDLFPDDSDAYPEGRPYPAPHPAFKGTFEVLSSKDLNKTYEVDLGTGECECHAGAAWKFSRGKWVPGPWCRHKMRAAATVLSELKESGDSEYEKAQIAYNKLLGERYIIWESISAFHKELRRGDEELARYWALSVAAHRGLHGVVRYMLNILFEESRDLDLYDHLITLAEKGRRVEYHETMQAVRWFCRSPKKWELPGRLEIFLDEMRAYKTLAEQHSYDVAKPSGIIDSKFNEELTATLIKGLKTGNRALAQTGLKGLQKSNFAHGFDALRVYIFNVLTDALNREGAFVKRGPKFPNNLLYAQKVHALVYRRYVTFREIGYHDLNALCDALTGESYSSEHLTPAVKLKALRLAKRLYAPPPEKLHPIPLYALDNHNHRGKHLLAKYGRAELQPGAEQTHIDFRLCGAYLGVAWRYLAYRKNGTCEVPWAAANWGQYPWLHGHVINMFY